MSRCNCVRSPLTSARIRRRAVSSGKGMREIVGPGGRLRNALRRRRLRAVRRLLLDVPDVLREIALAEHLTDRLDLADVEPVGMDEAQDRRALRLAARLAVQGRSTRSASVVSVSRNGSAADVIVRHASSM